MIKKISKSWIISVFSLFKQRCLSGVFRINNWSWESECLGMESRTVIYMLGGYERFFIFLIFKKRFMSFYKRFERVLRFKSVLKG